MKMKVEKLSARRLMHKVHSTVDYKSNYIMCYCTIVHWARKTMNENTYEMQRCFCRKSVNINPCTHLVLHDCIQGCAKCNCILTVISFKIYNKIKAMN